MDNFWCFMVKLAGMMNRRTRRFKEIDLWKLIDDFGFGELLMKRDIYHFFHCFIMIQRKIMAIGAHADDHELNVGGTLAKYHELGYEIVYVMATTNMSGDWIRVGPDGSTTSTRPPWSIIRPQ